MVLIYWTPLVMAMTTRTHLNLYSFHSMAHFVDDHDDKATLTCEKPRKIRALPSHNIAWHGLGVVNEPKRGSQQMMSWRLKTAAESCSKVETLQIELIKAIWSAVKRNKFDFLFVRLTLCEFQLKIGLLVARWNSAIGNYMVRLSPSENRSIPRWAFIHQSNGSVACQPRNSAKSPRRDYFS